MEKISVSLLYICPENDCGAKFTSEYKFHLHLLLGHQTKNHYNKYFCNVENCTYTNSKRYEIKEHLAKHFNVYPRECKYCDYKCKFYSTLKGHVKARHSRKLSNTGKTYICPEEDCGNGNNKVYKSDYEFHLHLISDHQVKNDQNQHFCTKAKCTYQTPYKHKVIDHLAEHYEDIYPCACQYCSYRCNFRSTLKSHIIRVHKSKKSRKLKNVVTVEPVVQTVKSPDPEPKSEPKSSTDNTTQESPKILTFFSCSALSCSKSFRSEYETKLHSIINHRQEEACYHCTECDYKHHLPSEIEAHLKSHFNTGTSTPTSERFKCDKCQESYAFKSGLSRHKAKSKCGSGIKQSEFAPKPSFQQPSFNSGNNNLIQNSQIPPHPLIMSPPNDFNNESIANLIDIEMKKIFPDDFLDRAPLHPCKHCTRNFKSNSGLRKHVTKIHPETKIRSLIRKHGKLMTDKKFLRPTKFDINKAIKNFTGLKPPLQNLTVQNAQIKDIFDFGLDKENFVGREIWSPPPSPPASDETEEEEELIFFICLHRRCQLRYRTAFEYNVHLILDHLPAHLNQFECQDCRMIVDVDNTESHIGVHHKPTLYTCENCDYRTFYNAYMERHNRQQHSDTSDHVCTVCNLTFDSENSLDAHASRFHQRINVDDD